MGPSKSARPWSTSSPSRPVAWTKSRPTAPRVSDEELDERIDSVKKTDLCSIVYTSGSTAAPKGVEMTHEHYCQTALNLPTYMPELLHDKKNTILLFLPQAHSFARAINYIVVASNVHIYIASRHQDADQRSAGGQAHSIMIVVPRVLEKVYNAASQKAGHGPKGVVFASAVVAAQNYMKEVSTNGKAGALTRTRRAAFDPIVYSSLREVLGGRAKWIVAGGAPLDPELLAFFRGAGVPVYEGYGLTETTAPCAFNPLGTPFHAGSVGIAFPGFSLRIAEDGEIQVKGRAVFPRYHKNDEATELSFTEDGWYATGDLGRIDNDGFLYITGRKKDLIITAGGKNVSPGPIEEVIQRCEFVSQALVLGDKRPFISALVTLDEKSLRPWLAAKGLDENMSAGGRGKERRRARRSAAVGQSGQRGRLPRRVRAQVHHPARGVHPGERPDDRLHEGDSPQGHQALLHPPQHPDVHQAEVNRIAKAPSDEGAFFVYTP